MAFIRMVSASFAYPNQSTLIADATFHLDMGWTGVVGKNGAGKSTLLSLMARELSPDEGVVQSDITRVGRCPQASSRESVEAFATAWTSDALRWLSLLELDHEDFERWDVLSPGMRKRWQVAAALWEDPELLLLDEPTNHLDEGGRRALEHALRQYSGIGLVVSHDRSFLNTVTAATLRIHRGTVQLYEGGYSVARRVWRGEEAQLLDELVSLQERRDQTRSNLGAARNRHAGAEHALSSRTRMRSAQDSDGRSTARKSRAENAERSLGRSSSVASAAYSRAIAALDTFDFRPGPEGRAVELPDSRGSRQVLVSNSVAIQLAPSAPVLGRANIRLERGERFWLRGANGCGKSTLLRNIYDGLPESVREQTLFLPQALGDIRTTVIEGLAAKPGEELQRVFNVAAALGLDVSKLTDISRGASVSLSPGEWRKAGLASGLAGAGWLLLLDEPTNDLDIPSVERLEVALQGFGGGMIVVTHDPMFADALQAVPMEVAWESAV